MNASTSFQRHYSYRPADAAFGFAYDAYSTRFRGSWYMNPEYDAEELSRSMRWASESVRSDAAANMGVAIVPHYMRAAHTKLLGTPGVHVLATMSPGFRFIPQDAWKGGEDLSTGTKFAVDIVVFYNEAGRRAYGGGLHRGGALARYLHATFKLDHELTALPALDQAGNFAAGAARTGPTERLRGPPRFHLAPPEAPLPPPRAATVAPHTWASPPRAARWDSHEVAYTDGSKSPTSCAGAGVWWPNATHTRLGTSVPPVPAALRRGLELGTWRAYRFVGVQNSLRAELVALQGGISESADEHPLVVFTDCQTALHLVSRFWRSPHTLTMHHELPLIRQIADAIEARHNPVRMVKVPAHVGLHGNEVADSIAKWATLDSPTGTELDSQLVHLTDTASVHPRGIGMACPWDLVSPATRKAAGVGDEQPAPGAPSHMLNSRAMFARLAREDFVRKLLKPGKTLPHGVARALGPRPLDLDNPHRPCRKLGAGFWSSLPDWFLRTVVRVRSNDFFAGKKAFFAGATDSEFCTICNCQLAGGGWEHTVSQCAHPSLQGMIINRHNEVVHLVRDAVTAGRRGNASTRILADLSDTQKTRQRLPSDNADGEAQCPLVDPPELDVSPECPEWDGLPGDLADDSTLHGYVDPSPDPPMSAVEDGPDPLLHARRLNTGAPGPVRIGREVFPILPFRPQGPPAGGPGRQSATVPQDILETTGVHYIKHDTPDIVMIEPADETAADPRERVQLIDIAVCLEHRVAATIAAKRLLYRPLRTALANQGYIVPPVEVVVVCARGAIPTSTVETLHRLGVNPGPTEALLRTAHVITTSYLRRICHTRRIVEATAMGTHGIVTRLIATKRSRCAACHKQRRRKGRRAHSLF